MDATIRTPLHLWIVGALATLWNCIGPVDYVMTRSRNDDYLRAMMPGIDPQSVYAWVDSMPIWSSVGWALGVWGGLAGSLLLLARSRHAVLAFAISLAGVFLSLGYQMVTGTGMPGADEVGTSAKLMPIIIMVIAAGLLIYARAMRAKGVLR